jgi:WD40 repeat protein
MKSHWLTRAVAPCLLIMFATVLAAQLGGGKVEWLVAMPARIGSRPPEPPAEILRDAFNGENSGPAHIYRVVFSPNGGYFLAGGDAGTRSPVRVYHARTGKLLSRFIPKEEVGWTGGGFSPDSTKVVSWGTGSAIVYVWESATGRPLLKLEGHQRAISIAAFSPDGKRIVSGSADHTLRIWDAYTGKELLTLAGHRDDCGGCFSPDGKWIVSFSNDRTIRGWDAATGKEIWKQTEQSVQAFGNLFLVNNRCFSSNGLVLCFGGDGNIRVLELATGKSVADVKSPTDPQGAVFIRDGQQVVWWAKDKTLRVWDVPGGRVVRTIKLGDDLRAEPDNVTVSLDGCIVLTGHTDQTVRIRDLAKGIELHRFGTTPQTGTRSLALSPDNHFAAAGSFRGWVYLWRLPAMP